MTKTIATHAKTITPHILSHDANDEFRSALNLLARVVLTAPGFDHAHCYISDLSYDATRLASMGDRERLFIVVTDVGTHCVTSFDDVLSVRNTYNGRALMWIEVLCTNPKQGHLHRTWRMLTHSFL